MPARADFGGGIMGFSGKWVCALVVATVAGLTVTACSKDPPSDPVLSRIRSKGELAVLTRNAPTTYYEGTDGLAGMEYDMAEAFGKYLGVKVHFELRDSVAGILDSLAKGEGDLAAAGLTHTIGRAGKFRFGPTYQQVRQQVVCRRGGPRPKSVADLVGLRLTVAGDSSYVERLKSLKAKYPKLHWKTTTDDDTEELMEQVWKRKIDCTVADSNIVAINRRYYPALVVAFDLAPPQPLAWAFPDNAVALQKKVREWFRHFHKDGRLDALKQRYYGYVKIFDYVDTRAYVRRIKHVLPRYEKVFKRAAKRNGFNWTLLAAQSYQESHWNPRARSPTGVRGMMMLTRPTAKALGLRNRLNPVKSIQAGARYLARLRGRVPDSCAQPVRTWVALAGYTLGMAHVLDARVLARKLGKDPDRWGDLAQVLPLLSEKRYYHHLDHGYARGREAVRYVNRVRYYQDILRRKVDGSG